jgi:hypothetical protein
MTDEPFEHDVEPYDRYVQLDEDRFASNFEDEEERLSLAMFEGDTSTLFPQQRLCLHALLKHRYISADRHPEHWAVLMDHEGTIASRLHDLFLDLHVDREHQIAFKRAASSHDEQPLPSLLRNVSHSKEETIMMVSLRRRFFAQRQEGDDAVFIDRQTVLDEVADQRPDAATNRAIDHKRANTAIDALLAAGVLLRTGDPDRFQISPIVEVLLPIEKLRALWTWLLDRNGSDGEAARDEDDNDDDEAAPRDSLFDTHAAEES